MSIAGRLHQALADAGLPVVSVSIGSETNRNSWRVSYGGSLSQSQRDQEAAIVQGFDIAAAAEADKAQAELGASDAKMARIVEDLYNALVSKGTITSKDLPQEAVATIEARADARKKL